MRSDIPDWTPVYKSDFWRDTAVLGYYLQHKLGIKKGETIVIMARSSYWTLLMEFACLRYNIIVVPVYETASKSQIYDVAQNANSKYIYLDTERHRDNCPSELYILCEQEIVEAINDSENFISSQKIKPVIIKPSDPAFIMQSASMNKENKGVAYTHEDVMNNVLAVSERISRSKLDYSHYMSFLSLANIAPKVFLYSAIYLRSNVGICLGVREIMADLQSFRPTFIIGVPRVFDRIYSSLYERTNANSVLSMLGFDYFSKVWRRLRVERVMRKKPSTSWRKKLRDKLGGRLSCVFSTALKPDEKLLKFFNNLGVSTCDCYSVTEFKGIVAFGLPDETTIGTVGKPLSGYNVNLVDGDVYVDGVRTGDLGELNEKGELTIRGRDKDVIIISSGHRILPEPIQQAIATDPIIEDVLIIGEHRPYLSALITLDREWLEKTLEDSGIELDSLNASVYIDRHIKHTIDRVNHDLPPHEHIERYLIIEDSFIKLGQVSGSLRLKRDTICKQYKDLINGVLYR